jgi:hypothetical protein
LAINGIIEDAFTSSGKWETHWDKPVNWDKYIKARAGKDNPEERDVGVIGFTWGLTITDKANPATWYGFRIENHFMPRPLYRLEAEWVQAKIPVPKESETRYADKIMTLNHFTGKIGIYAWGTERKPVKSPADVLIEQIVIFDLSAVQPHEIKPANQDADKHQVHIAAQRAMRDGERGGWHDVRLAERKLRSVPLEIYVPERFLWLFHNMIRKK